MKPPGEDVAVYEVTGDPFGAAAVQTSATLPFPAVALERVGAPGPPAGVADSAFEAGPVPRAFVAVTVKVYEVPFARPLTVQPSAPLVQVKPPGEAVAVYDVTGEPFPAAADQDRLTEPFPALADCNVGAPGSPEGRAEISPERALSPTEFTAVTW